LTIVYEVQSTLCVKQRKAMLNVKLTQPLLSGDD